MTQLTNQFSMSNEQGSLDLALNLNILSGMIAHAETGTLIPGQAVKLADMPGKVAKFLAATATDNIFGFVVRNIKDSGYTADKAVEVAFKGTFMWMTAAAAFAPGTKLMINASTKKVLTKTVGNSEIGWALDKASSDGDLVRVCIETPQSSFGMSFLDLSDTPNSYATYGSDAVTVNSGATALEFTAPST